MWGRPSDPLTETLCSEIELVLRHSAVATAQSVLWLVIARGHVFNKLGMKQRMCDKTRQKGTTIRKESHQGEKSIHYSITCLWPQSMLFFSFSEKVQYFHNIIMKLREHLIVPRSSKFCWLKKTHLEQQLRLVNEVVSIELWALWSLCHQCQALNNDVKGLCWGPEDQCSN